MQDIAVIPILLMISIFTLGQDASIAMIILETTLAAIALLFLLYLGGKYLLEPFFEHVISWARSGGIGHKGLCNR